MKTKLNTVLLILIVTSIFSCTTNKNTSLSKSDNVISNEYQDSLHKYFPTRMHAFIWRNWESVPVDRIAKVLNTNTENVLKEGRSMGLTQHSEPNIDYEQRGYISLIRRNWNLISYE